MNDNQPWPRMNQAAASHVVRVLAQHATWRLADMPADYGLPLAACLREEASSLLVTVTDGALSPCVAALTGALKAARSDGLIIGSTPVGAPQIALGLWCSGQVVWHRPLFAWLAADNVMWLVPARKERDWRNPAFKLTARHLRADLLPWQTAAERSAGFARAAATLDKSNDGAVDGLR